MSAKSIATSRRRRLSSAARPSLIALALVAAGASGSCITIGDGIHGAQTFEITILKVNGDVPPSAEAPLPANIGDHTEVWDVQVQALDAAGNPATDFNGYVRLSVRPGTVVSVIDANSGSTEGRNVLVNGGTATAQVAVTAVYGPSRLWAEDLGYIPAPEGQIAKCANGKNDDGEEDSLVDFPNDPGCAFADDDTETGGTFSAGVSPAVEYQLPTLAQIQGNGATTPFPFEAIQAKTADPQFLVVTRIAKDGFYVTDLADQANGYNHLFAFNFSTPSGMQVCDRVVYLSGTLSEFFGFTELNFPSYRLDPLLVGQEDLCQVPEPKVIPDTMFKVDAEMEKYESGLVRVEGVSVPKHFGSKLVENNAPNDGASNCDLNGDGVVDFEGEAEGSCSKACDGDIECSEWTAYVARGNYKVHSATNVAIQINTDNAPEFVPTLNPGVALTALTGTMRNFSGGSLNWTIEVRCPDDLVCGAAGCTPPAGVVCTTDGECPEHFRCDTAISECLKDSKHECVNLTRTEDDNDEGTN